MIVAHAVYIQPYFTKFNDLSYTQTITKQLILILLLLHMSYNDNNNILILLQTLLVAVSQEYLCCMRWQLPHLECANFLLSPSSITLNLIDRSTSSLHVLVYSTQLGFTRLMVPMCLFFISLRSSGSSSGRKSCELASAEIGCCI